MKKQILNKVSAAVIALAMMTPALTMVQNTLLADILGGVGEKKAFAQYASVISNTATVTSGTLDTNMADNTAVANDMLCYAPDIEVTSFTDTVATIQAASTTSYSGVITNNGVSKVTTIQYTVEVNTDFLNVSGITFASTVGTNTSVSSSASGSVTTYVYNITGLNLLPTQSLTVNVTGLTVAPTAVDGTSYSTTFAITPTAPTYSNCAITDPNTANNTAADSTSMVRVADLALVKTSTGGANSSTSTTGTLNAGQTMSYTINVTNNGPSQAAANIVVVDTWPSQIVPTIASGANYTASANWNCTFSSPTMTCTNTNPLANGASSSIVIAGTVNQVY